MKRPALGHALGYTALTIILTAGAAQSLAGSNTVFTDDIAPNNVTGSDIKDGEVSYYDLQDRAVTSSKIRDGHVKGVDVDESSLVLTCPTGMSLTGDVCYGDERPPAVQQIARDDCADEHLRLPTLTEARLVTNAVDSLSELWTDYVAPNVGAPEFRQGIAIVPKENWYVYPYNVDWSYRCVTTVGSRP